MNIPNQNRECHAERSEESRWPSEILQDLYRRSPARNDSSLPILVVNLQ